MSEELFLSTILPSIFLACGIGLLIGGLIAAARTRAFLQKAIETAGEVIALEEEPAMEAGESCTYRPVVAFLLESQHKVQFKSMVHSNPPAYQVGEKVRVLYEKMRPQEARIKSFTSLWLLAMILVGLGSIFTILGVGLLMGLVPA